MFHAVGPKATGTRRKDNYSTPPGVFFLRMLGAVHQIPIHLYREMLN